MLTVTKFFSATAAAQGTLPAINMNTRRHISLIFILTLICSCNQTDKKKNNSSNSANTDTSGVIASSSTTDNKEKFKSRIPKTKQIISNIDSFLLRPFDLYKFKKIKGGSNSGGAAKRNYYFKPKYKGIYYSFFLFEPWTGYIGDSIVRTENGLGIRTFKPLGKYQNDYLDPNEELIEVIARYNDFDLPELAFIGLDTIRLSQLLGKESFIKDNCFFYVFADRALILGFQKGRVSWLKYIHLKTHLTADNVPSELVKGKINCW